MYIYMGSPDSGESLVESILLSSNVACVAKDAYPEYIFTFTCTIGTYISILWKDIVYIVYCEISVRISLYLGT